jgi:hypothetical protein
MAQVITRVYSSHQSAMSAVDALKKGGFGGAHIVAPPAAGSEGHDAAATAAAIHDAGISKAHADAYAKAVGDGGTLVSVEAPFGGAGRVTQIMDSFNPVKTEIAEVHAAPSSTVADWAAPFSAKLGWKTLLHDPAPFSRLLGWATLKQDPPDSGAAKKVAEMADQPSPFSDKLGWKTLLNNPTPLSTALGWATLSEKKPSATLSDNPTPLSTAIGWPTLSDKKPSATLSDEPAPFSKKLGWKVLSDEDKQA